MARYQKVKRSEYHLYSGNLLVWYLEKNNEIAKSFSRRIATGTPKSVIVFYLKSNDREELEKWIQDGEIEEEKLYIDNNFIVVGEYIDVTNNVNIEDRQNFMKMINDSNKKQFEGIIVYQLDRFARNRYDSATYKAKLKKNGVKVYSARENISDDASGILMESVLEGMAEYYSAELGQKVNRNMKMNAENGFFNGGYAPLGYTVEVLDFR